MDPIIHLYGMRIKLSGDLDRARERVHLANQLRFKTQMVNVNNLDIVQNFARLDDGTTVRYVGQHGMDLAEIYVPPRVVQVPRRRKWIEVLYHPAFEVSFGQGEPVAGWVIARGEGWQEPYEFIPKPDNCKVDIFNYGSWWTWYETMPFILEEFLKPKLISIFPEQPLPRKVTRKYEEIPPHGTINRIFDCAKITPEYDRNTKCFNLAEHLWVCRPNPEPEDDLDYVATGVFWRTRERDNHDNTQKSFTIGSNGDGEEPEYWPDTWEYQPKDHILPIIDCHDIYTYRVFHKWAKTRSSIWFGGHHTCDSLEADFVAENFPETPGEISCDGVSTPTNSCDQFKRETLYDYNAFDNYHPYASSAEDESHYFVGYLIQDFYSYRLTEKHSIGPDGWWDRIWEGYEITSCKWADADVDTVTKTEEFFFYTAISNEIIPIPDFDDIDPRVFEVRYYRVGESLEFGLMNVFGDEAEEFHYVFVKKTPDNTEVEHSISIPGDWDDGHPVPFIKGPEGQDLYSNQGGFRLIRETVTYEEEL